MLDKRGRVLRTAALGFIGLRAVPEHPGLPALHQWLDSWRGVGHAAVGMHRQGWDLQFTEYGDGHWRATFYVTGMAHSIVGGSAWEATAWQAVQRAAWEAAVDRPQRAASRAARSCREGHDASSDDLIEQAAVHCSTLPTLCTTPHAAFSYAEPPRAGGVVPVTQNVARHIPLP